MKCPWKELLHDGLARDSSEDNRLAHRGPSHVASAVETPGDFPGSKQAWDDIAEDVDNPCLGVD